MSGESPTVDKEQKTEAVTRSPNKNGKKNDAPKVSYVKDTGDVSKRPTVLDGIQKEVVLHERKSQATWEKKFGYLSGKVFHEILAEEAVAAGLPSDTFKRKKVDTSIVKHFPINLSPSPPIPKTSLAIVGWRSAREECRLEFKGQMYISPKRTIDPPPEPGSVPLTQQRFIILG